MNIDENKIFIILNSLHDRKDKIAILLNSFSKTDILLNNIYRTELNELNEIINELTR